MAEWKYIMYRINGRLIPIIFPGDLIHSDIAQGMIRTIAWSEGDDPEARWVSAGFISGLAVTGVQGESETLKLRSRDSDASIINLMPYESGRPSVLQGVEKMLLLKLIEHLMDRLKKL